MDSKRNRRNLCGQVLFDLGSQILGGKLLPGDSIPQEAVLCESMGVSRTVVREAIKSLAAKGHVDSRAKRGTVVLPSSNWNYLDPDVLEWHALADSSGALLESLTEFRRAIEPAAAALAAKHGTDNQLQNISSAFNEMESTIEDVDAFLAADIQFHTAILHATGNPFFSPVANVISKSLESSIRVTKPSTWRQPYVGPSSQTRA